MKALGHVVSDKNIFKNFILKTFFSTPWPTYATNWNGLNNFGREAPRDHSCGIWLKSNEWFQRRNRLNESLRTHALTHWRLTDKGLSQWLTLSTLCSGELKQYYWGWHPPFGTQYSGFFYTVRSTQRVDTQYAEILLYRTQTSIFTLKMLGLYLCTLIIGHKPCNILYVY